MRVLTTSPGAAALLGTAALAIVTTPYFSQVRGHTDALAVEKAPLDPSAPDRTRIGSLVWRGGLKIALPEAAAEITLSQAGEDMFAGPVLATLFADGSALKAPLDFDGAGGLVGVRRAARVPAADVEAAASLAEAAVDDGEDDDQAALAMADAPSVSVAADGRLWSCADRGSDGERCRLVGHAPVPRLGTAPRLLAAEHIPDRSGYALLWSVQDRDSRPEAVVSFYADPTRTGVPASATLADLRSPLLPGKALALSAYAVRNEVRLFILAQDGSGRGARLLAFDWPAGAPPSPPSGP